LITQLGCSCWQRFVDHAEHVLTIDLWTAIICCMIRLLRRLEVCCI